jgi:valyl-tRNA synthetase
VLATPDGQDPWISKNTFEGGRNFVNKLYQVSRFIMMRLEGRPPVIDRIDDSQLDMFDRWILSRLEKTKQTVNRSFREYRLSNASKTLYNFVWDDFCSWYIELIKPDQPGEPIREQSLNVATYVLYQILRLMHPFTPFVTEEVYRQLVGTETDRNGTTLTFGPWPAIEKKYIDDSLEDSLKHIQEVVTAVRSIRSELNVPPGKRADLYVRVSEDSFGKLLEDHIKYFRSLARVNDLHCGTKIKKPPLSASAVISGAEIFVPLEGLIDIEVEKKRLQKDLDNLKAQLEKVSKKLANQDFLAGAPPEVIERERAKKADYEERTEKLNKNLEQILGW